MKKKYTKKDLFKRLDEILLITSSIHSANLGAEFPKVANNIILNKEDFIDKQVDKIKDVISDLKSDLTFDFLDGDE